MSSGEPKFVPLPKRWYPQSLIAVVAGWAWLLGGEGTAWHLWALLPGSLLLSTGVSLGFWPGEQRILQFMAAGGAIGVVFALPGMFVAGFFPGLIAAALSLAAFVTSGRLGLEMIPRPLAAPEPDPGPKVAAKAAVDQALLAYFTSTSKLPRPASVDETCTDSLRLVQLIADREWRSYPERLHRVPTAPSTIDMTPAKTRGHVYRMLRFASGYQPDPDLPEADRWSSFVANRECHALLFQHQDRPRDWILGIHGYRMGHPLLDTNLFAPDYFHHRLGLNLLLPRLPLHGPRRIGPRSGDGYLDVDPIMLLHAQIQALWDLRRSIAWIRREQPDARIGVLGYSLGGFNAALLAAYESDLAFVVAGIPLVDLASIMWQHLPPAYRKYFKDRRVGPKVFRELLSVVSPLLRPCQVPEDRRAIFAGVVDRVITPEHPLQLARHWNVNIEWYQGGHLTFRGEEAVRKSINSMLQTAGWSRLD